MQAPMKEEGKEGGKEGGSYVSFRVCPVLDYVGRYWSSVEGDWGLGGGNLVARLDVSIRVCPILDYGGLY
jgi:hypothetical protein